MRLGLPSPLRRQGPQDPSVRRTWWLLSGAFVVLGSIVGVRVLVTGALVDWVSIVAVGLAAIAAVAHRNAVAGLESRGRGEAESYARILRGLSRSVSSDAIVAAIMDDLVDATGADHVAVVRRRRDGTALEATLVTRRAGVPTTSTMLPIADLVGDVGWTPPAPVAIPVLDDADVVRAGASVSTPPSPSRSMRRARPEAPVATVAAASAALVESRPSVSVDGRPHVRREPLPTRASVSARVLAGSGASGADGGAAAWRTPERLLRFTRRALGEGLELLRDLGFPTPAPARGQSSGPTAEVLATGIEAQITERIAQRIRGVFGLSHTLAVPLRGEHGMTGAIVLSRRDFEEWPDAARRLLRGAASETAAALARADSYRDAATRASTDPLTGLPNRRYFDEFCGLLARRRRSGDDVAVLMIDIDRFKLLNDTFGHPTGDVVLKAVGGAIASAVREEDVPARVGGEEFAVLLRNPGPEVAAEVGERVRQAVRGLDLSEDGVPGVSVSVGVANTVGPDEPIAELIERADEALRRAKRAGRNRVIAS